MSGRGSWRSGSPTEASTTFATDSQIAGDVQVAGGRSLKRFDEFSSEPPKAPAGQASASASSRDAATFGEDAEGGRWDQFKENERIFGVTTSFDEDEYTTKINRADPRYAERVAEAERLAKEIERGESNNPHVREERGQVLESDGDEEDRFSGVRREAAPPLVEEGGKPVVNGVASKADSRLSSTGPGVKLSYAAAAGARKVLNGSTPAGVTPVAPKGAINTVQGAVEKDASTTADRNLASHGARSEPGPKNGGETSRKHPGGAQGSLNSNRRSFETSAQFPRKPIEHGRASPNRGKNSPLMRTPSSPSPVDTAPARGLSLEADTPGVGPEIIKRFENMKREEALQSVVDQRSKTTDEFKKFSADRNAPRSRNSLAGNAKGDAAQKENEGAAKGVGDADKKEAVETKGDAKEKGKRASKFKLNPDAKSFVLRADADEFVPGGNGASGDSGAPSGGAGEGSSGGGSRLGSGSADDASARIPSSPGPGLEAGAYVQDPTMQSAAAAAAAGLGAPMQFMGGQYHPGGGMPGVAYGVGPHQMPHMNQHVIHPNTMIPHGVYHHAMRAPYGMPGPQFGPPGAGTPPRSYMPPGAGPISPGPGGIPYGVPANAYPPATHQPFVVQQPSQPVGHPVPNPAHMQGRVVHPYAGGQGFHSQYHGGGGRGGGGVGGGAPGGGVASSASNVGASTSGSGASGGNGVRHRKGSNGQRQRQQSDPENRDR